MSFTNRNNRRITTFNKIYNSKVIKDRLDVDISKKELFNDYKLINNIDRVANKGLEYINDTAERLDIIRN